MTSLPTPESVEDVVDSLHHIRDVADRLGWDGSVSDLQEAADTIEQQAAEIERLKEENKALGIADAHHFDEYAELKARAEAAEARIVELTRERDEWAAEAARRTQQMLRVEEELEQEKDALTAENAVLREALKAISESGPVNEKGQPDPYAGWAWCQDMATQALPTPNPKAMRMVEVVKASQEVVTEWTKPITWEGSDPGKAFTKLQKALAALDGEQG